MIERLTPERLAYIRKRALAPSKTPQWWEFYTGSRRYARELLAHIDHLEALIARMRSAADTLDDTEAQDREANRISNRGQS